MKQESNIDWRAEKEYRRKHFDCLLREILSNAFHSVIMTENVLDRKVDFDISITNNEEDNGKIDSIDIIISDNGEGFTTENLEVFKEMDRRNNCKVNYKFSPKGQGRLALVYFTDSSVYNSVYKEKSKFYKRHFKYPLDDDSLFDPCQEAPVEVNNEKQVTSVAMRLTKSKTINRAITFFNKYDDIDNVISWVKANFTPLFLKYKDKGIIVRVNFNGDQDSFNTSQILENVKKLTFSETFKDESNNTEEDVKFDVFLLKNSKEKSTKISVKPCARGLIIDFNSNDKIEYRTSITGGYDGLLSSEYFDKHVENSGEKIVLPEGVVEKLQDKISAKFDTEFAEDITNTQSKNLKRVRAVKKRYPSLSLFIDENEVGSVKTEITTKEIIHNGVDLKGQ